jgi:hypothetical protein
LENAPQLSRAWHRRKPNPKFHSTNPLALCTIGSKTDTGKIQNTVMNSFTREFLRRPVTFVANLRATERRLVEVPIHIYENTNNLDFIKREIRVNLKSTSSQDKKYWMGCMVIDFLHVSQIWTLFGTFLLQHMVQANNLPGKKNDYQLS